MRRVELSVSLKAEDGDQNTADEDDRKLNGTHYLDRPQALWGGVSDEA